MQFETIEKLVNGGISPKIHIIDYWSAAYLFTGRVINAYTDTEQRTVLGKGDESVQIDHAVNRVNLQPYVGLKITNGKGTVLFGDSGMYSGLEICPELPRGKGAGQAGSILMKMSGGPTRMRVTTGIATHERSAAALVRRVCGEETVAFMEYLERAKLM